MLPFDRSSDSNSYKLLPIHLIRASSTLAWHFLLLVDIVFRCLHWPHIKFLKQQFGMALKAISCNQLLYKCVKSRKNKNSLDITAEIAASHVFSKRGRKLSSLSEKKHTLLWPKSCTTVTNLSKHNPWVGRLLSRSKRSICCLLLNYYITNHCIITARW
jgi:hypothetical protein